MNSVPDLAPLLQGVIDLEDGPARLRRDEVPAVLIGDIRTGRRGGQIHQLHPEPGDELAITIALLSLRQLGHARAFFEVSCVLAEDGLRASNNIALKAH